MYLLLSGRGVLSKGRQDGDMQSHAVQSPSSARRNLKDLHQKRWGVWEGVPTVWCSWENLRALLLR